MSLIVPPQRPSLSAAMATDESVYCSRRQVVAGLAALGLVGVARSRLVHAANVQLPPFTDQPAYNPGRRVTPAEVANRYNNFYEFTTNKEAVWRMVGKFEPRPWTLTVEGACHKPRTIDVDALIRELPLEQRVYRFRCVEAWSMVVPWVGFPLAALLKTVEPLSKARYVRFESFDRPKQAPGQRTQPWYPWPYFEGLRMDEAMNDLALMVVGAYGETLPKQHGAPIRLAVPWKYGFKSIKSVQKITLLEEQPETFWHKLAPREYGFSGNVDPTKPHPRWSQATERDIETGRRQPTLPFNGYGEQVAHLYRG